MQAGPGTICTRQGHVRRLRRASLGMILLVGVALPCQAQQRAPMPVPRPHGPAPATQTPVPQQDQTLYPGSVPVAPATNAKPADNATAPVQSRAALRAEHRACAEEWGRMKKAGTTNGLIWPDFFQICRKRL